MHRQRQTAGLAVKHEAGHDLGCERQPSGKYDCRTRATRAPEALPASWIPRLPRSPASVTHDVLCAKIGNGMKQQLVCWRCAKQTCSLTHRRAPRVSIQHDASRKPAHDT
jgi:hypothetical protein